jgi:hypothetical protein
MDLQTITSLLLAASIVHTLHSFGEVRNIREKVKRLEAYIAKKPYKEIPININTRLKGIGFGYLLVIVLFLPVWGLVNVVSPSVETAVVLSLMSIILIELINTVTIDAYHAEIEKVTQRFKK